MAKFAVILLASPGDLGRAVHGLLYAKDLNGAGHEVQLLFDGAGTTWVKEFEHPEHKYHQLYKEVKTKGLIGGACEYCAKAFKVDSEVSQAGIPALPDWFSKAIPSSPYSGKSADRSYLQ